MFSKAPSILVLLPLLVQSFMAPLSLAKGSSAQSTSARKGASDKERVITPTGNVDASSDDGKGQIVTGDERKVTPLTRSPLNRAFNIFNNFERMLYGPDISPFTMMTPFGDEDGSDSGELSTALSSLMAAPALGQLDIAETDKEFKISVDLPGIRKEDINVEVNQGILTIAAQRREDKQIKNERFTRQERSFGSFQRALRLPSNVNPDTSHVKATYDHGVLQLELAKSDDHKPETKRIAIH